MKALSLWEPWASLVAISEKEFETRSWSTKYRGPLAIHAAKTWTRDLQRLAASEPFGSALHRGRICIDLAGRFDHALVLGAVIAVAELVDVVQIMGGGLRGFLADGTVTTEKEFQFGNYSPGRFAWKLSNVRRLARPIPFRGGQRLFNVPDHLLNLEGTDGQSNGDH